MATDIFLLDTNILSESSKPRPHPTISAWLRQQRRVAIPFAVILEVETGIADKQRSNPDKAEELWRWMDELLETDFEYPAATPQVARVLAKLLCCKPLTHLWLVNEHADRKKVCGVSTPLISRLQRSGLALAEGPMSTSGSPGRGHYEALIRCA
jgi:hypothetical protein